VGGHHINQSKPSYMFVFVSNGHYFRWALQYMEFKVQLYETHNLVRKVSLRRYDIELPKSNVILFHSIPTCFFVGNDTNNDIY
jgi:hypothetical protein